MRCKSVKGIAFKFFHAGLVSICMILYQVAAVHAQGSSEKASVESLESVKVVKRHGVTEMELNFTGKPEYSFMKKDNQSGFDLAFSNIDYDGFSQQMALITTIVDEKTVLKTTLRKDSIRHGLVLVVDTEPGHGSVRCSPYFIKSLREDGKSINRIVVEMYSKSDLNKKARQIGAQIVQFACMDAYAPVGLKGAISAEGCISLASTSHGSDRVLLVSDAGSCSKDKNERLDTIKQVLIDDGFAPSISLVKNLNAIPKTSIASMARQIGARFVLECQNKKQTCALSNGLGSQCQSMRYDSLISC